MTGRNIKIDRHFITEKIDSKEFMFPSIRTQDQFIDIFIKGL